MHQQAKNILFSSKRREEFDEVTFVEWKNELKKNLPNFWETMNQT